MKKTTFFRRVALTLVFALVITSFAGITNVNKAQAAMTAGNVVYEGNGSLTCGSATLKLENGVLTYIGSTTKKYWDNPVAGTMVINQKDRLGHVFWYSGIYFVIDMDNGTIIQAYKNSSNSYCIKSSGAAVYGSSAYMATINTCIIDDEWFYQENIAKMQRLMTRAEFDRISKGEDPVEPTQAPTVAPTTEPTVEPTATPSNSCGPTASCQPTANPTQTPANNGGCKGNCGCGCGSNCNDTCCGGNCSCKKDSNSNNSNNNNSGDVNVNGNNNTIIINGSSNNGNSSNGGNASLPNLNVKIAGKEKMNLSGKTFVAYPKEKIIVPYNAINAKGQSCKVVATSASKNLSVKVNSKNKLTITVGKKAKDAGKYKVMVKNGRLTSYITVFVYKHRVVTSGKRIKLYKKQNKLYGWLIFNSKKKKINWNGLTMKNVKSAGFIEGSWRIGVILRNGTVKSISYKEGTVRTIGKNAKCFRRNERGCIVSYVKKNNKTVKKITGK